MARIEINDHTLSIVVEGFDRILAVRARVTLPLSHIVSVRACPDVDALLDQEVGAALRGAMLPRCLIVGSCPSPDGRGLVFCDVHDPARAIVIRLRHDSLPQIFVEISDESPSAVCERIEEACGSMH